MEFDDILKGLQDAKDYTVHRAEEIGAHAKTAWNIQSEKAKLSRTFREIGKYTLRSNQSGEDNIDKIAELCGEANDICKKLLALELSQGNGENKTVHCPFCSATAEYGSEKCEKCGAPLPVLDTEDRG